MEDRNRKCQHEKEATQPDSEFRKHGGRLSAKEIIGQTATECRTQPLALRALHKDRQDHQKADDHKECYKNINEKRHSRELEPEAYLL